MTAASRPDAISGEPEFVSRTDLAEAADAFVAAMGSRNRMMFSANLRNVASNSDAMQELFAALGRTYMSQNADERTSAAASEAEYERRMTCPRCGQYGDGCNCDAATRSPQRIARAVKGWRCYLGFHSWRIAYVCDRKYLGGTDYWEVSEECERCGEERSYDERNRRVADAIEQEWRATL